MTFWPSDLAIPLVPLKHVAKIDPEVLPESTDPGRHINYVDIGNVTLESGITGYEEYVFGEAPSRARKVVRPGDTIVSTVRTYLRAIAFIESQAPDYIVSTGFAVLRPTEDVEPRYLYRVLQSEPLIESIVAHSTGVSYPAITTNKLGGLLVPLPDLQTQRRIADFLDRETARVDGLVHRKDRIRELIHEKIEAEISIAVMQIAAGNQEPLHRIAKVVTGGTPSRSVPENFSVTNGVPWATPVDLGFFDPIRATRERLTVQGLSGQIVVPAGTTLVTGIGTIGKTGITDVEMSFNQQIHAIIPYSNVLLGRFIFYAMWSKKRELESLASNTTLPIINADRFSRIRIPVPETKRQIELVEFLDKRISALVLVQDRTQRSIEKLMELRSALITAAVTGRIDVDTWR